MTSLAGRRLVGLCCGAALVLLLGGGTYLLFFYTPPKPAPSAPPPAPVSDDLRADSSPKLEGTGVYALTELFPSFAYVIKTTKGLAIVDTGSEGDCSKLLPLVKKLGLDIGELKIILLTHCHGDHVNGAQLLRELTGAKVYAGKGDSDLLRAGDDWDAIFSTFQNEPGLTIHPTEVDVDLVGDETIVLGDVRFDVLATPGHTPGSMCYLMRRGEGPRILFSGDTIVSFDRLGTYSAYLSPRYRGDAEVYLKTLRELSELYPPHAVMPGHPVMSSGPIDMSRANITKQQWNELLGEGITAMMDLLKRYETDGRDFLDGRPRELLPGLTYLGNIDGAGLYCLFQGDELSLIDAPGGAALVDVLDSRLAERGLALSNVRQVLLTSCDPQAVSGLAGLVERTGCRVVAGEAGLETLAALCPPGTTLLAAESLQEEEGQIIWAMPLAGLGIAPTAYLFELAGKDVLATGRLPMDPNGDTEQGLFQDPPAPGSDPAAYLKSMQELAKLQPDVWLSAKPVHERNANLYEDDWKFVVEKNIEVAKELLSEAGSPSPAPESP